MSKNILDYVMESPENTNPAVLGSLLDKENVQADWNQNDESARDYIKNRPFYTGDPVETVLVEESTVPFAENSSLGLYIAAFPSTFEATVGDTYKVSWDGTVYECVCAVFNSYSVIGNLSVAGAGSDTGEPFIMLIVNGSGIQIYTADTSVSHTFSIISGSPIEEVVKIDRKYLPSPLIIDATNLPTNVSGWRKLYEKIDSAYKDRREILLNVYGDDSCMLPCVSWHKCSAIFIYPHVSLSNLYVYALIAMPDDGGSLKKRIIAMQEEVS